MFKVIWVCTTRRIYVKFFGPCCTRYNVRRRFQRCRWIGNLNRANLSSLNLAWSKIWSWCILTGWLGNVCVMGRIFIETIWWSLTLLLSRSESNDQEQEEVVVVIQPSYICFYHRFAFWWIEGTFFQCLPIMVDFLSSQERFKFTYQSGTEVLRLISLSCAPWFRATTRFIWAVPRLCKIDPRHELRHDE